MDSRNNYDLLHDDTRAVLIRKMLQRQIHTNTYSIVTDFSYYDNGRRSYSVDLNQLLVDLHVVDVVEFLKKLYEIVDALPIGGEVLYVHRSNENEDGRW